MKLHFKEAGRGEPLIILHGVFGSLSNWNAIAKQLAHRYRVFTPDLRNHGRSPHAGSMTYQEMAQDIAEFMQQCGLESAHVIGHSMGGKVAMVLALTQPQKVRKLIVLDIAPLAYPDRFSGLLAALEKLELDNLKSRKDADRRLADAIPAPEVRSFLLQNLTRTHEGFSWRINLPVIARSMPQISAFPSREGQAFPGESLFVRGSESDYIPDQALPEIKRLFPAARLATVTGASHWLHHEQPQRVTQMIEGFLRGDEQ